MNNAKSLIYIFSVIGILDTSYLLYHKFKGTDVACLFFPKEWCRKVQYSKQSKTFGIPNSLAGFFMYSLILLLTYLASDGNIDWLWPRLVISLGWAFSMYFTYVQAFVLKAFCTWCVISTVNFTVMFIASFALS